MTTSGSQYLLDLLDIDWPIIQAPMAGISTPQMAAAVSNTGALGSIGVGAMTAAAAAEAMRDFRARSTRSLNVNVFCHHPAVRDSEREATWLEALRPEFDAVRADAPRSLREIYRSFVADEAMFSALLAARPRVLSCHFGLPSAAWLSACRAAGIVVLATATNFTEATACVNAGVQAIIAQGYEAGGHRGIFDPDGPDERLSTLTLTRLLARKLNVPVIAAGGIMDGRAVSAALRLGAGAAQLGTAFVGTQESAADEGYRAALFSPAAEHTVMTRALSGRPARCLANRFTTFGTTVTQRVPSYPIAYDAAKALHAAAKAVGEWGYGAQWAGQGAPLARRLPAAALVAALVEELNGP